MSLQKLMTNYAAYNLWANQTMVEWLRTKTSGSLEKEVPSSFSSILKTLNHILATQEFWQSVTSGTPPVPERYHATELNENEITNELIEQSGRMLNSIQQFTEEDLLEKVYLDTPWVKGEMPRYEFLQHVFNHSTYHRGQVVTIGRNIDITDAPMTDYNFFNMALSGARAK
ncbi:MAG: DinB family protein [Bacteroidota bacterium]